jgi:hypothetical protein
MMFSTFVETGFCQMPIRYRLQSWCVLLMFAVVWSFACDTSFAQRGTGRPTRGAPPASRGSPQSLTQDVQFTDLSIEQVELGTARFERVQWIIPVTIKVKNSGNATSEKINAKAIWRYPDLPTGSVLVAQKRGLAVLNGLVANGAADLVGEIRIVDRNRSLATLSGKLTLQIDPESSSQLYQQQCRLLL